VSLPRLLDLLGLRRDGAAGGTGAARGETETVRRIAARLEGLAPERARRLAAFAYVLARVAHADLEIDAAESAEMERIVRERGGLDDAEAALAAGKEPLESELLRAPDGTSRVTAAYARRQRGLEQAVAKARTALEKLRAGK